MFCSIFLSMLCSYQVLHSLKLGFGWSQSSLLKTSSSILCLKLCHSTHMFYFMCGKVLKCLHYSFSVGLVWLSWLKVLKGSSASEQAVKDKASSWPFFWGAVVGWRCVCFGFHCSHIQTEIVCLNISGCLPHCLSVSGLVGFSSALFCCSG